MKQPEDNAPALPDDLEKGVSRRALERLQEKVPCDVVVQTIHDMLNACTPQGNPDWRARETGVKLWLSYVVGLPVQRQEIVTHKITSAPTVNQLLKNPATIGALIRQIAGDAESRKLLVDALRDADALEMPATDT